MKVRIVAILAVLAILLGACARGPEPAPNDNAKVDSFCPTVERKTVDFSVLNDVRVLLDQESVFADTAQNSSLLLNSSLETLFNYLGVRSSNIPEWARDIVAQEIESSSGAPDFAVLNQVTQRLQQDPKYSDLNDPTRIEELIDVMINGALEALGDPFASYMEAKFWLTGFAQNSGRYEGVGISTSENSRGEIAISSVTKGAPAEGAGLRIGDAILEVNGLSTAGCTNRQFVLTVRGTQQQTLKLKIAREDIGSSDREVLEISVTKEEVKEQDLSTYPAVELPGGRGSTLDGVPYRCGGRGIGSPCPFVDENDDGVSDTLYVKIHSFTDQMARDLEHALRELDSQYGLDSFKSVVVDVRDNPGGLVSATVAAVDFFMPTIDEIFTQKEASGLTHVIRRDSVTYIKPGTPIVVLMNDQSASGSEVFAAALRDNGHAVIVNRSDRSRGKGTVNRWFALRKGEYGAVYVSIAMWLTPSGEFIETRDEDNDGYDELGGLKPDIQVPWTNEDYSKNNQDVNYDPTLNAALEWLQEQLNK